MTFSVGSTHFGSVTLVYPKPVDLVSMTFKHQQTESPCSVSCNPGPYAFVDSKKNKGAFFVYDQDKITRYIVKDSSGLGKFIGACEAFYLSEKTYTKRKNQAVSNPPIDYRHFVELDPSTMPELRTREFPTLDKRHFNKLFRLLPKKIKNILPKSPVPN